MPARRATWLALAVLLIPFASALPVEGEFTVTGDITFTPAATGGLQGPFALLVEDTTKTMMTLRASDGSLCRFRQDRTEAEVLGNTFSTVKPGPPDTICYPITDAFVSSVAGNHSGWVGIYPSQDAKVDADLENASTKAYSVVASPEFNVAAASSDGNPNAANQPHYYWETRELHLRGNASSLQYVGPLNIKILGPDVMVQTHDNTTSIRTGDNAYSDAALRQRTREWLYLSFPAATLTLDGDLAIQFAAENIPHFSTQGAVAFTPVQGAMTGDGADFPASGRAEIVNGRLVGSMMPLDLTMDRAKLRLAGDLRSTSIQGTVPVPQPSTGGFASGLLLGLGLVAVGGIVGAGFAARALWQRRHVITFNLEIEELQWWLDYHLHYADLAMELEEREVALGFLDAARALAPHDHEIPLWMGLVFKGIGLPENAAEELEDASKLAPNNDGTAEYYLAKLLMEHLAEGGSDQDARAQVALMYLERALHREPGLADTIDGDEAFAPLRGHDFDAMLAEARDRKARHAHQGD